MNPDFKRMPDAARRPFATYLNAMHNRFHPMFAGQFLCALDGLPAEDPINAQSIFTRLEIVLDAREGNIVKMGVVHRSGVPAFDAAALDLVDRAAPFGPPPPLILSIDGHIYLTWEFHRDPVFACSTINSRPFLVDAGGRGP